MGQKEKDEEMVNYSACRRDEHKNAARREKDKDRRRLTEKLG
jgi:hypothetical protein